MGPLVSTLVLHPAVLIASGFESLTSRQVRFLNEFRKHFFDAKQNMAETIVIAPKDFELGGITNPHGEFWDINLQYTASAECIPNFPYLSKKEILDHYYLPQLMSIWNELLNEIFRDLDLFSVRHKKPIDYLHATTQVLHALYPYPIYQKITSLHLCGLGHKMMDAFDYAFTQFKKERILNNLI